MTLLVEPETSRPRTHLRQEPAVAPARTPRATGLDLEQTLSWVGPPVSALALAWLITHRLVALPSLGAYVVVWCVCTVVLATAVGWAEGRRVSAVDRLASTLAHLGMAIVLTALGSTLLFVAIRGFEPLMHANFFTEDMAGVGPRDGFDRGGVAHAIAGSLIQIGIAVAITLPLGVATAVYMTEVGGGFARVVRTLVEAMTALPSIVAGLFIYTVAIVGLGIDRSGLAAGLALAVMMLPIIARAADVVLRVVPSGLREGALALGASRWRTVWHVVLPTARPGLATALILGIARGIGETSPVLLTSGAASFMVTNPTEGVMNSLPLYILTAVRSGEPVAITRGFAAAAVLLAVVTVLFVTARLLARPRSRRSKGRLRSLVVSRKALS